MKNIFTRVLVYFSVVLSFFTVLVGLMFTRFNNTNIVGAYKKQLGNMAAGVAKTTSLAAKDKELDKFLDYLRAVEDLGRMQNIDIWIISNEKSKAALGEDYTNVDWESIDMPEETNKIVQKAFEGKKKSYSAYDDVYQKEMLHLAVPIRNKSGEVSGAVLVSGPMEMQKNTVTQYEKYMFICVVVGGVLAFLLALYFSRQLARPIIKIKETALVLAGGDYARKTGIRRKDELGELAESMDVLSDRLVEAEQFREDLEQSRRDFFSNVSHELRTPIAVIKGYAETLADGYVTDEKKKQDYIERIRSECGGMERLVSDLLILSRMQNPDYELNLEVLNVLAVAQDAMRSMRILMKEKKLTGEVLYEEECLLIEGDYDRIRQLFIILLQNAVKYCDEGTAIQMRIVRKDGVITVHVLDFGSVIPEQEWGEVFEKFYRASNHGEKEGSGLGLVVAYNIVERHGGTISVRSSEEEGTCFMVQFPETTYIPEENDMI